MISETVGVAPLAATEPGGARTARTATASSTA
jgi:hypothetical protein